MPNQVTPHFGSDAVIIPRRLAYPYSILKHGSEGQTSSSIRCVSVDLVRVREGDGDRSSTIGCTID